jgi:hypothetical protein
VPVRDTESPEPAITPTSTPATMPDETAPAEAPALEPRRSFFGRLFR